MENLTLLVPFFNGNTTITRLLDSVPESVEVLIVDDKSDAPLQLNRPNVRVVGIPEKGYFSGAVNYGMEITQTDALILNQDSWFDDERWMDLIAENRDEYAVLGDGVMKHPAWPMGYVQGTFMFIRRDAWEDVGPFNVADYPLWGSTCEWQLRACRAGFRAKPMVNVPGFGHRQEGMYGSSIKTALRREPDKRGLFIRTPPAISVIIPCYDYGRYLPDAINSLIGGHNCLGENWKQSFQSFEIIIVDDASTEQDTREVVRSYANAWKGIRAVMLEKNRGTPGAINAGIENAFGTYITILSADDMREGFSLEKQYRAVLEHPNHAVYADLQVFKNGQRAKVLTLLDYDFDKLIYRNAMDAGIMYPKVAWEVSGGYPEQMIYGREDWAFNVALGLNGYCGHKMEGVSGYLYRREGQNRSVRTQDKDSRNRFVAQMKSLYPNLYEGERPVRCCGGRRRSGGRASGSGRSGAAAMRAPLPGQDGMRMVEYVGANIGASTFWGPVTGTRYKFGQNLADRVGYVDAQDYQEMLEMFKNGKHLFVPYTAPKPAPIEAKPAPDLKVTIEEERIVRGEVAVNATPAALRFATEVGLSLVGMEGTGKDGRITKGDVEALLSVTKEVMGQRD